MLLKALGLEFTECGFGASGLHCLSGVGFRAFGAGLPGVAYRQLKLRIFRPLRAFKKIVGFRAFSA